VLFYEMSARGWVPWLAETAPRGEGAARRVIAGTEEPGSSWRVSMIPRIFRVPDPSPLRVGILTFPIPANRAQRPDPRTRRVGHP